MKVNLIKSKISNSMSKLTLPFSNRKAALEQANVGVSLTMGIIYTLIGLTIMLGLFALFLNNAKEMQNKEKELRQKENDSISLNTIQNPSYRLPNGCVIDLPNC